MIKRDKETNSIKITWSWPLAAIVTIIFYVLKYCSISPMNTWSGWMLHLPLIIGVALGLGIILLVLLVGIIVGLIQNRR